MLGGCRGSATQCLAPPLTRLPFDRATQESLEVPNASSAQQTSLARPFSPASPARVLPSPPSAHPQARRPVSHVAAGAPRLESSLFAKLCKECGLVNDRLRLAQVDLVFGKVADKVGAAGCGVPGCRGLQGGASGTGGVPGISGREAAEALPTWRAVGGNVSAGVVPHGAWARKGGVAQLSRQGSAAQGSAAQRRAAQRTAAHGSARHLNPKKNGRRGHCGRAAWGGAGAGLASCLPPIACCVWQSFCVILCTRARRRAHLIGAASCSAGVPLCRGQGCTPPVWHVLLLFPDCHPNTPLKPALTSILSIF